MAVKVLCTVDETGEVAIENWAVVAPAGTSTFAGADAFGCVSASATVIPPAGAGPVRVILPDPVLHPQIDVWSIVTDKRAAGMTVSVADRVDPAVVAEI